MKVICVGRNYGKHATELNNEVPTEPILFIKPDSAILQKGSPFFIPDFTDNVHYEVELVVKIKKLGKNVQQKFAHKYYDEIGLGLDFTARDLQEKLKKDGLPWEKAKGFDGSCLVGTFVRLKELPDLQNISFQLIKNGKLVQDGHSNEMLFPIDKIIADVSGYFTLKIGDLIFTGTPAGVGKIEKGDLLEGMLEGKKHFSLHIK